MRIKLIPQGFHLLHVRLADRFVAAFVENYAGIVSVIDDRVAHQLNTLFPAPPRNVLLRIACGHRFHQADAVARLHILLPGCHVHPAD